MTVTAASLQIHGRRDAEDVTGGLHDPRGVELGVFSLVTCPMAMSIERRHTIPDSPCPWERDVLELIRQRLPNHGPYRACADCEFIAEE